MPRTKKELPEVDETPKAETKKSSVKQLKEGVERELIDVQKSQYNDEGRIRVTAKVKTTTYEIYKGTQIKTVEKTNHTTVVKDEKDMGQWIENLTKEQ